MNFIENPVWNFLSKCVDLILLSLIWALCSLPVITLGASSAALYYSVHKNILGGEGYAVRSFFHSFRGNLKQGIFLTLSAAVPALFCTVSWLFADSLGEGHLLGLIYRTAAILLALLSVCTAAYAFALLSRFYMKTPDLVKTAFALAITRGGFSLLLLAILAACAVTVYLIPASVCLLPGLAAAAAERLIEPALKRLQDNQSGPDAEE